jgi:hypothetical protein
LESLLLILTGHGRSHPAPTAGGLLVAVLLVWLCGLGLATTQQAGIGSTQLLQHAVLDSLTGPREVELSHVLSPTAY